MQGTATNPGDEALVRQTLAGDHDAFGRLVAGHARTVRALCLARLGFHQDLDDLVQETFVHAYQGLDRLREPGRFAAYLARIAQNLCVDRLRRTGRAGQTLDVVEFDPPAPHDPGPDPDRLALLRRHIGRLPEALREAVLLFYFEQRSYAEIAGGLGITEAAVNQRLHRAKAALREALGEVEP